MENRAGMRERDGRTERSVCDKHNKVCLRCSLTLPHPSLSLSPSVWLKAGYPAADYIFYIWDSAGTTFPSPSLHPSMSPVQRASASGLVAKVA